MPRTPAAKERDYHHSRPLGLPDENSSATLPAASAKSRHKPVTSATPCNQSAAAARTLLTALLDHDPIDSDIPLPPKASEELVPVSPADVKDLSHCLYPDFVFNSKIRKQSYHNGAPASPSSSDFVEKEEDEYLERAPAERRQSERIDLYHHQLWSNHMPTETNDVLLFDERIATSACIQLSSSLKQHYPGFAPSGTYSQLGRAILENFKSVHFQPVLIAECPKLEYRGFCWNYVANASQTDLQFEPIEFVLPRIVASKAEFDKVKLGDFKEVIDDSAHRCRASTIPHSDLRNKFGETIRNKYKNSPVVPLRNQRIIARAAWKIPDSSRRRYDPAFPGGCFVFPFAHVLRDSIHEEFMPYLRVAIRPVVGQAYHDYGAWSSKQTEYMYRWNVYLRTDMVNEAIRAQNVAAMAVIRNILVAFSVPSGWVQPLPLPRNQVPADLLPRTLDIDPPHPSTATQLDHLSIEQRSLFQWLQVRERPDSRLVTLVPHPSRTISKVVRLGSDGAYFEPTTGRFSLNLPTHVVANPVATTTIHCPDSIVHAASPAVDVLPSLLALIKSDTLSSPSPSPSLSPHLPDAVLDLIPSRATLVICSRACIADWAIQAQQQQLSHVIVLDLTQDLQQVSWANVCAADLVIASDQFMLGAYHRILERIYRDADACCGDEETIGSYPWANLDTRRYGADFVAELKGSEDAAAAIQCHIRQVNAVLDHVADFGNGDTGMASATVIVHRILWRRIIFDGPTRNTRFADMTSLPENKSRSKPFLELTPLREFMSQLGAITVLSPRTLDLTAANEYEASGILDCYFKPSDSTGGIAGYQMLGLIPNDLPRPDLPIAAQLDLLHQISVTVPAPAHTPPGDSPVFTYTTVPVYPALHESIRASILTTLAQDSLEMSVRAVQHHHVPLNLKPRYANPTTKDDNYTEFMEKLYDSASLRVWHKAMDLHAWDKWHNVAHNRQMRGIALYDDWLDAETRPAWRVDKANVDDWVETKPEVSPVKDPVKDQWGLTADECERDRLKRLPDPGLDATVRGLLRTVMQVDPFVALAKMRVAFAKAAEKQPLATLQAELGRLIDLAHFQEAERKKNPDADWPAFSFNIPMDLIRAGLTLHELTELQVELPHDYRKYEHDPERRHWVWFAFDFRSKFRFKFSDWQGRPMNMDNFWDDHVDDDLSPEHVWTLVPEAHVWFRVRDSLQFVNRALTFLQANGPALLAADIGSAPAPPNSPPMYTCNRCHASLAHATDAWLWFMCGHRGCTHCAPNHLTTCTTCLALFHAPPVRLHVAYHPSPRFAFESRWINLLYASGLYRDVAAFCVQQLGAPATHVDWLMAQNRHLDCDGSGATVFARVFGSKIQAVIMYIAEQIKQAPSTAKFVVFSEYISQQHLLGLALRLACIRSEIVLGGSASPWAPIRAFRTQLNVRVLILAPSQCQYGMRMAEVTHAVFMHPWMGEPEPVIYRERWSRTLGPLGVMRSVTTEDTIKAKRKAMQRWMETERNCLRILVQPTHLHKHIAVARFIIQHTRESELEEELAEADREVLPRQA